MKGTASDVLRGAKFLFSGLRLWGTSPRMMFLGAMPALIVGLVYIIAIALLVSNFDAIATWVTPFADEWEEAPRDVARIAAGLALASLSVLVVVYTYTAVTLAVGDPFYERIWRAVEERAGGVPRESAEPAFRRFLRGVGTGIRLFAATAVIAVFLFACGFIPVVGQTLVPVLGATFGGWFLALELSGFAFDARGLRLRDRRRMLGARRARTVGFGAVTYLAFLVPFAAVFVMPAAVAGATLLARDALSAAPDRLDG